MRSRKLKRRVTLLALSALGGGMVFASGNGCLNTLLSIPVCGTVVPTTVCTPEDQLLLTFRFLQVPDFGVDPSCTIPYSCGDVDFPFGGGAPQGTQAGGTGGGGAGGGGRTGGT